MVHRINTVARYASRETTIKMRLATDVQARTSVDVLKYKWFEKKRNMIKRSTANDYRLCKYRSWLLFSFLTYPQWSTASRFISSISISFSLKAAAFFRRFITIIASLIFFIENTLTFCTEPFGVIWLYLNPLLACYHLIASFRNFSPARSAQVLESDRIINIRRFPCHFFMNHILLRFLFILREVV